ncbi:MAG: (2Fe-2S)-binding protein, partial [bacterium]|nr:(2Fe-2S)-binding protein [bacterium]
TCTILLNGKAVRSCVLPVSNAQGAEITTIEGLSEDRSHPVQQAWLEEEVSQCGYCQPGQILTIVALLDNNPDPSDADIDAAITNICRCGTYPRIRKAIHRTANM